MPQLWSDRQKERGIKLSLTWFSARKCWKKKVGSENPIYLKQANSSEGYQAALLDLARKISPADFDPAWERKTEFGEIVQTFYGHDASPMEQIARLIRSNNLDDKVMTLITGNQAEQNHSWASQVDLFLKLKEAQAVSGSRSTGTWGNLSCDLQYAERFFGSSFPLKLLTGKKITEFYIHLGEVRGKGDKLLTEVRKLNVYRSFKQFVSWYWRQDDTELPTTGYKALKNPDLTFAPTIEHSSDDLFTREDIAKAMSLSPRWKAWILLCLNCGFTQADISILERSKLKGNRLTHKRAKTKRVKSPPTVIYKLWPETVAAIEETANKSGLLWTTKNDLPMITEMIIEKDGVIKRRKWDNIGNRWAKLQKTVEKKAPNKPLKFLRKTGRTLLRKNGFGDVADMYLGHAPNTMGGRHYDVINGEIFEPLDKATDKLRKLLIG